MEFKRIEPRKTKGETDIKTEIKVGLKEISNPYVRMYLHGMGLDFSKPVRESSRFAYFIYNGDWLNSDHRKKFGY